MHLCDIPTQTPIFSSCSSDSWNTRGLCAHQTCYDVAPWSQETVPGIVVEHLVYILHHTETRVPLGTYTLQQITPLSQQMSFLPHYLAQSDRLAADRQGQGDTRLTLMPSAIPNSNYVIMVGDWNCLKYCIFACFLYCNRQVHRDFLITLYISVWFDQADHAVLCMKNVEL